MAKQFLSETQAKLLREIASARHPEAVEKAIAQGLFSLSTAERDEILTELGFAVAEALTPAGESTRRAWEIEELIDDVDRPRFSKPD